jgi:CheY-like chemotaxis protein
MAATPAPSKHVLVVNDAEEIVELFRDIVEGMGHRFSGTTFAPDDLSEVIKAEPDLVIMDLILNGEKVGWQLVQKMRMSRETQDIPILICTAVTEDVREQEGRLLSQAAHLIAKPFSVDQLELAITKALALPDMVLRETDADSDRSRQAPTNGHT